MVKSKQWILARQASDLPTFEGDDANFKLTETDLPELKDGQVLVKALYLSNDPAQRGWISAGVDPKRLYTPPVQQGEPMRARALAEVIETKASDYKKGDYVLGTTNWSQYAVLDGKTLQPAPELPGGLSRTHYLGALGLTGLTAYYGIKEIARTTSDDTVIVSGAAGATGSMVVQIAKKLLGAKKVIGLAGSADKCRWVESLGADICINYKDSDFREQVDKATPDYATVFFDNVGGDLLDYILTRMARHGRIAACGSISNYNLSNDKKIGIKNWFEVVSNRLEIRGFIVLDFADKFTETREIFRKAVQDGKLTVDEKSEHVVPTKFEDIPRTWLKLFEGANTGKLVTAIQ